MTLEVVKVHRNRKTNYVSEGTLQNIWLNMLLHHPTTQTNHLPMPMMLRYKVLQSGQAIGELLAVLEKSLLWKVQTYPPSFWQSAKLSTSSLEEITALAVVLSKVITVFPVVFSPEAVSQLPNWISEGPDALHMKMIRPLIKFAFVSLIAISTL